MLQKNHKYILAFHHSGFGEAFIKALLHKYDGDFLEYLWQKGSISEIHNIMSHFRGQKIHNWETRDKNLPDLVVELLSRNRVNCLFLGNSDYPFLLSQIFDPPPILYYKGDLRSFDTVKNLGVIGSRRMTSYGMKCIEKLIPQIISYRIGIVSGLALGTDAYAHEIAIKHKGKVIAVIGSGLSIYYPSANEWLYREIIEQGGIIVSPFSFNTPIFNYNFPLRNRIISGLSHAILIVEAAEKSGTIITAKSALEQGRDVLVIPGDIFRELSVGTNELWKEGAIPISSSKDILRLFGFENDAKNEVIRNQEFSDSNHYKIWEVLLEPMNFDELMLRSKINFLALQTYLSQMELTGLLTVENGLYKRR